MKLNQIYIFEKIYRIRFIYKLFSSPECVFFLLILLMPLKILQLATPLVNPHLPFDMTADMRLFRNLHTQIQYCSLSLKINNCLPMFTYNNMYDYWAFSKYSSLFKTFDHVMAVRDLAYCSAVMSEKSSSENIKARVL